jgi:transcriptional regulator of acetoin/glycerol metabolism
MVLKNEASTKHERRQRAQVAWQRFVHDREMTGELDSEITLSWIRSRDHHALDPGMPRPARALDPPALAGRRDADEVYRVLAPMLRGFISRVGSTDHVLAYFDAEGYMLSLDGDPDIAARAEQEIGFTPGSCWAEDSAGTCGPGLALVTCQAVEVLASEHFVEAFHPWSDAASPILIPGSAAPVGVIDVTGPWEVHRRQALQLTRAIASAIEERVTAAASVRDEVVRHALRMAQETGDALVAVDVRGRVIAANGAAARRRVVETRALPPFLQSALAAALGQPAAAASTEVRLESERGDVIALSVVRHAGSPVGAVLRLISSSRPRPRQRPATRYDFESILGRSAPFRRCVEQARAAAANDLPVVLTGASGSGKELLAQSIHAASGRRGGPFVAVNCASIPEALVEAELFGYEAGAFTGASREGKAGRFEDASGGTLFLDEVSELPLAAQSALLRVLQEREVVRVGSGKALAVDVRVVAATNKPLEDEIQAGRFRRDLYYRLDVLPIHVPSLRERSDDVALLAEAFLSGAEEEVGRHGLTLAADALEALRAHAWPGNVRELKNVILRAAATAPTTVIRAADLVMERWDLEPARIAPSRAGPRPQARQVQQPDRAELLATIEASGGSFTRAAAALGVSRMTLYRWAHKLGIPTPKGAAEP